MITSTDIRRAADAAVAAKAQYGDGSPQLAAAMDLYNKMRALRDEQNRFAAVRAAMDPDMAGLHERTLALAEARLRYGVNSFQARAEEAKFEQAKRETEARIAKERREGMRTAAVTGWFQDLANKLRIAGGGVALIALGALWFLASGAARRRR